MNNEELNQGARSIVAPEAASTFTTSQLADLLARHRAAALEEAAMICDKAKFHQGDGFDGDFEGGCESAAKGLAAAIRAAKEQ